MDTLASLLERPTRLEEAAVGCGGVAEGGGDPASLGYFPPTSWRSGPRHRQVCVDDDGATGTFDGLRLRSVFQSIVTAGSHRMVAVEALVRAVDRHGQPVAPPELFRLPRTAKDSVYLDRLCRILHAMNFARQAAGGLDLFLNVDGRHLLAIRRGEHGSVFEGLLRSCGLPPSRIVLEILESRIDDGQHLAEAVAAWQRRGFRIALDDFGSRHSNFDRLWQLGPDIIKLDRRIIQQVAVNARSRRILPKLVEICHGLGTVVICEGIETTAERDVAEQSGADLLQGFLFSRPEPRLQTPW